MMAIKEDIICDHEEMVQWRRELHAHPEIAFKEFRTSKFVADYLEKFGIEVVPITGIELIDTIKIIQKKESDTKRRLKIFCPLLSGKYYRRFSKTTNQWENRLSWF